MLLSTVISFNDITLRTAILKWQNGVSPDMNHSHCTAMGGASWLSTRGRHLTPSLTKNIPQIPDDDCCLYSLIKHIADPLKIQQLFLLILSFAYEKNLSLKMELSFTHQLICWKLIMQQSFFFLHQGFLWYWDINVVYSNFKKKLASRLGFLFSISSREEGKITFSLRNN